MRWPAARSDGAAAVTSRHAGLDSIADDDVFDLIVVGAGMATALFAAIEGLRVVLV